jgi:hypothetical protein
MKLKITGAVIIIVALLSCKEDFSPEANYRERNTLNCIIRPDTGFQSLTLFRTYKTDGNPNQFDLYPFIDNADVKIWYNNKVYQLKDTILEREDNERYKEPVKVYYNNSIKPVGGKYVEVEALLPNGLLLRSETLVPDISKISFTGSAPTIPSANNSATRFIWSDDQKVMYHPRFLIIVVNRQNQERYAVEVPLQFVNRNLMEEAVYPSITSEKGLVYDDEVIRKTFIKISNGDPVKSNYAIIEAYLELMVLDRALSVYYSSIKNFLDEYTIRVDLPDYTNIEGGFGIFGSYNIIKYKIAIDENFVKSFGYIVGF